MHKLKLFSIFALFITFQVKAETSSFILYNYPNMPKSVAVFQFKSRTFVGKIEVTSEAPITCTHTERGSKDYQPVVNVLTLDGQALEFSPQRYMDHEIICALKNKTSVDGMIEIQAKYLPEILPDESDEKRSRLMLQEWIIKAQKNQDTLKLDMPPKLCEEKVESQSFKIETGFIYRMTSGGEACSSPIAFANGNILSFCSKKIPTDEFAIEVRSFTPLLKPLLKTVIMGIETDTLRPKILKTKLNKEIAIIHSLSGKMAGIDSTGKKVFDLQLPTEWISVPTIHEGLIYTASLEDYGIQNHLYILDATGKILGQHPIPGESFSPPLILNNQIILGNNKSQLVVMSAAGEITKTLDLSKRLSNPGGEIKHLFLNQAGELLLATDKG
ncbi:MAG: hypothetical protein H0V66_09745, partial [Bdellovibrionales bacterium]|nr:hypothetical protein [Bdellovibrionales bacterium]